MSSTTFQYILFTHLPDRKDAWDAFKKAAPRLAKCLNRTTAPGLLIVFVDPGWTDLLNTIGDDFDPVKMSNGFNRIEQIEKVELKAISGDLGERLRVVTAKTLYPVLNNLRGNKMGAEATRLKNFLVGSNPGVRYDTTKVVEAIIRVRHFGAGIPALRADWDALFSDESLTRNHVDSLAPALPHYCNELAGNHLSHSFLISGVYLQPDKRLEEWGINDFNTAFATRMFPALIPTEDAIRSMDASSFIKVNSVGKPIVDLHGNPVWVDQEGLQDADLDTLALHGFFDASLMNRYYGLNDENLGLPRIGSNPKESVISGAGLVISEGAILDLPPFSNFLKNVMWIDDYLKYELHRALKHFSTAHTSVSRTTPALPCRLPDAKLFKDRILGGQGNLRPYILGEYIPTLFRGILMDAWIRGEPPVDNKPSSFVEALRRALKRGLFDDLARNKLRAELERVAQSRINMLIKLWSDLVDVNDRKSFAALWVGGHPDEITTVMGKLTIPKNPDTGRTEDWDGWGLLESPLNEISSFDDLRNPIRNMISQMIEDTCAYIDWTLEWPKFVQSIRAIPFGTMELDISWTQ